jgi:putative phage-type endonuclease
MKKLVSTKNLPYEQWLDWRRKGIGGSDAPAIMGVSPWQTPFDTWLDKTGQKEDEEGSERMYWGNVLEEIVAREFAKRNDMKVRRQNYIFQHSDHEFMLANVDRGIVGERALLECKTTNAFYKDEGCPEHYTVQAMHYMAVMGYDRCYLAVLAGGQKYYQYTVERDNDYIDNKLIPAEQDFWNLVKAGEMPEVDGSDACSRLLAQRYAVVDENDIELPEDAYELLQQYDLLTAQEKEIVSRKDFIANTVKEMMKENATAHIFDRKVFWSQITSNKFDQKAFAADNPDLFEKYVRPSAYRRFQVK